VSLLVAVIDVRRRLLAAHRTQACLCEQHSIPVTSGHTVTILPVVFRYGPVKPFSVSSPPHIVAWLAVVAAPLLTAGIPGKVSQVLYQATIGAAPASRRDRHTVSNDPPPFGHAPAIAASGAQPHAVLAVTSAPVGASCRRRELGESLNQFAIQALLHHPRLGMAGDDRR
jgi:hypothetical protein